MRASDVRSGRMAHIMSMCPVVALDSGRMVLCKDGQVGESSFVDSATMEVVEMDMATGKPTASARTPAPESFRDSALESTRAAIRSALEEYAGRAYSFRGSAHGAVEVFAKGGTIVIVTSAERPRLDNFWAGQWRGRWEVHGAGSGSPSIAGRLEVTTHYFEDGNVQMRGGKSFASRSLGSGSVTDPSAIATAVASAIGTSEEEWHASLSELLVGVKDEAMRELRRQLPVAGNKMAWTAEQHRFRKTLQSRGGDSPKA